MLGGYSERRLADLRRIEFWGLVRLVLLAQEMRGLVNLRQLGASATVRLINPGWGHIHGQSHFDILTQRRWCEFDQS